MTDRPRTRRPAGFTLIELLVVIAIIILVSAVTLPAVLPALSNRQVSEGARIFQAALAGARDRAIRTGNPSGIRLIPDKTLFDPFVPAGGRLAANRIIPIEPAADLTDGLATFPPTVGTKITWVWSNGTLPYGNGGNPPPFPLPSYASLPGRYTTSNGFTYPNDGLNYPNYGAVATPLLQYPLGPAVNILMVKEAKFKDNTPRLPNPPCNWFYNVRIGDRFRFHDSGRYYTIVGPMTVVNAENFVNDGPPGNSSLVVTYNNVTPSVTVQEQFLFLVNGVDDDNDGYIDNGFDGVDQNLNGQADDIAFNTAAGTVPEWTEAETWLGNQVAQAAQDLPPPVEYAIVRRPVPVPGAVELALPSSVVVDMTTWNTGNPERSRVPVDPSTGFVDVLLNPTGEVVQTTAYSNPASASMAQSFYHFWIGDRVDVYSAVSKNPQLPIPRPPNGSTYTGVNQSLQKDRVLVTLFARTGHVVTNSIENFDFLHAYNVPPYSSSNLPYDANVPYSEAQLGIREAK